MQRQKPIAVPVTLFAKDYLAMALKVIRRMLASTTVVANIQCRTSHSSRFMTIIAVPGRIVTPLSSPITNQTRQS